jgi:hypothetical protein
VLVGVGWMDIQYAALRRFGGCRCVSVTRHL